MNTTSKEIIRWSASRMAAAIRSKDISSREVVDACLERIAEVNPKLNAVVQVCAERARKEAAQADAALDHGRIAGPLHGVPITIKDAFEIEMIISAGGTLGRANFIPSRDATAVARLRAAGAIVIGKTNVPEFCLAFETNNLVYGRTVNPYDFGRTSGGSSGGEAAIIAACGSPAGLGSDTGGSIRLPSHFCGIAGLRPSTGRVPRTGHWPALNGAFDALTQVGPMARKVEDLGLLLSIIAGPDGIDPAIAPVPLNNSARVDLGSLRVAFHIDNGIASPTPDTVVTITHAASAIAAAGSQVINATPPGLQAAMDLFARLNVPAFKFGVDALAKEAGTTQFGPLVSKAKAVFEHTHISAEELFDLMTRIDEYRARMNEFMRDYDAILCPVHAGPAAVHDSTFDQLADFSYTFAYNLTGWPGVVVRCGTSKEGLPIGAQILARPWHEDVALALAQSLELSLGGWQAPPL
jgi:amidase